MKSICWWTQFDNACVSVWWLYFRLLFEYTMLTHFFHLLSKQQHAIMWSTLWTLDIVVMLVTHRALLLMPELSGTLPSSSLSQLESLFVCLCDSRAILSTSIPGSLPLLTNLGSLFLVSVICRFVTQSRFTGTIADAITSLTSLTSLCDLYWPQHRCR